jgi:predicted glycosyltransferase
MTPIIINKPKLLFYCQHSLGMGHLVRSFRLTQALARHYTIIFINGGPVPEGIESPENIQLENLPPLSMVENSHVLISRDSRYSVEQAKQIRQQKLMTLFLQHKPEVVVIELFPLGRKKFADELIPLLKVAQQRSNTINPLVVCSLRDILVRSRRDQQRFENRASETLNRYFDAILLHCDPAFATLEESFKPDIPLQIPVYNTGFVAPILPIGQANKHQQRERRILISAGGGIVGYELFQTAIEAQPSIWQENALPMTIVAGPFLPEAEWQLLKQQAANKEGLTLIRTVSGLMPLLLNSELSVSQCGYNTAMELLQSGIKALVVPFHRFGENEQMNRAKRLQKAGSLHVLEANQLNCESFIQAVADLQKTLPIRHSLDTQGAEHTLEQILMLRAVKETQKVQML